MQFVAFAAAAMDAGDVSFSNILSSIQTDEARHAQQGFPTARSSPDSTASARRICSTQLLAVAAAVPSPDRARRWTTTRPLRCGSTRSRSS